MVGPIFPDKTWKKTVIEYLDYRSSQEQQLKTKYTGMQHVGKHRLIYYCMIDEKLYIQTIIIIWNIHC